MAFERVVSRIPTSISDIDIRLLFDINAVATETLRTSTPEDRPISLSIAFEPDQVCELISVVVSEIGGNTLVEDTDYTVDYVQKTINPLASGNMVEDTDYLFEYVYDLKSSEFSLKVLDGAGEIMKQISGDLAPHLTANQRDGIIQLLDALRAKAESEVF